MFKVGDRILYKDKLEGIIITMAATTLPNRIKIKIFNEYTISGIEVETWCSIDTIKIDKAYYRDLKIKKLLDK